MKNNIRVHLYICTLVFLGLIAVLAVPTQAAPKMANTTTIVTPASADWGFINDNGSTGDWTTGFQVGPDTPPAGVGSMSISLTSSAAGITFGTQQYLGTRLADIQTLSYSTYTNLSPAAMSFQINYDPDVTTVEAGTWYGRLTYEPYQNGTVVNGTWQTWDMLNGGAGKWWASGPNGNSTVDDDCPQASPCTLTTLLGLYPNIGIRNDALSGIMVKAGSSWNGFVGNADNLTIETGGNTDIYDFEPLLTVYVDDSWTAVTPGTDPDGPGPATNYGADSFATIQEGLDAVAPGGTVQVFAGTYTEDLVVDKAVNLIGPNQGIDANSGSRVPEAVVHPATSAPDPAVCAVLMYLNVGDVTIDGFTLDGDNPGLTSGIIINGADVDACELISSYEGIGNVKIENNILKHSTYSGIDMYNYNNTAATAGNHIRYNLLQDIGETTYNWGIGVLIYNNFYADITDNVFTGVRTGIQTGNFSQANPGTTGSISNNDIGVWRLGIFHNAAYSNASPLTISNNTITAENYTGGTKWNGMLLSSIQNTVTATISNNDIIIPGSVSYTSPGYTAGYNIWSTTTSNVITIDGGSVTGGDYGIWVNNYEGYTSDAGNTDININNVTISNAGLAGIYVQDDPLNSNNATVHATIANSPISGSGVGILIEGSDATAGGTCNQISGNSAGLSNTSTNALTFETNWWGSVSGPSGVGAGSGDSVSADVNFTPWSTDTSCTGFAPPFSTTTTITADTPDSSEINQTVSVSATVVTALAGGPTPTGTVTISGGVADCTITLVSGAGSCDITFDTDGTKTITATYNPDTSAFSSSSDTESHTVVSTTFIFLPIIVND